MSKGESGKGKAQKQQQDERREPGTSTIEWIVAGIGCLLLLTVIAYLVSDALSGRNGPADIVVQAVGTSAGEGGYVVEFIAGNRAGRSAAGIEITGQLRDGDEVVEERGVTLDYVPQRSERSGALIFRRNPEEFDLRLFATGYTLP